MEEVKNVVFIRDYANYKKCDIVKYDNLPDDIKKMKGIFLSENEKIHEVLEKITNKNNIFFAKVKLVESILEGNKTEIKNPIMLKNIVGAINSKKSISIKVEEDIAINKKGLSVFYLSDGKENYGIVVIAEIAPIKGKAKAMGLKSSFIHNNSLILTTSASKNDNVIEKKIKDNKLISEKSPKEFDVKEINDIKIELYKENKSALIDNQMHRKDEQTTVVRNDYLDKKDDLEIEFFGKKFNDNIHIQLIYNILDIKKIMGLYIDDIIYMFKNLDRTLDDDILGTLYYEGTLSSQLNDPTHKEKANKFINYFKNISKYLPYFPAAFTVNMVKVNGKMKKVYDEYDGYNIFRILSMIRQFVKHSSNNNSKNKVSGLFNLENNQNAKIDDLLAFIDKKYLAMIEKINTSFVKNSQKNIYLIKGALKQNSISDQELTNLVNAYYDFSFAKANKNLGFSFVRLRELLLEKLMLEINDEDKGKYYSIIDFVLFYILTTKYQNRIDKMVLKLRECRREEEKSQAYNSFADELLPLIKNYIDYKLINNIKYVKTDKNEAKYKNVFTSRNFNIQKNDNYFGKIIYFMTCFLNPKEINMLLTSLINKFENINSLISLLKSLGEKVEFTSDYQLFNNLDKIDVLNNLNIIMNLSRIQKNYNKIDKETKTVQTDKMFGDVFRIFGYIPSDKNDNYNEFRQLMDKVFESTAKNKRERGEKSNLIVNGKKVASLRNFIVSNIINSNNFRFVVTYNDPTSCYKIMQNMTVVKFVLNNIPESQLKKYYQRMNLKYTNKKEAIEYLANSIRNININRIIDSYETNVLGIKEITNLYLAVLFIITKQMVQINSYYSIGFSCLERDSSLYNIDLKNKKSKDSYLTLLNKFIEKGKLKSRAVKYMLLNEEEYHELFSDKEKGNNLIAKYRNSIQHLNALSKIGYYINDFNINKEMRSYFELYNYIVQRDLLNELEHEYGQAKPELLNKYINNLNNYHTYDKELMKIMNLPLGYNLARYKNLTIEDIFYDKYKQGIKVD